MKIYNRVNIMNNRQKQQDESLKWNLHVVSIHSKLFELDRSRGG